MCTQLFWWAAVSGNAPKKDDSNDTKEQFYQKLRVYIPTSS
jgi:hypothetical protein